ncbi:hypothetical protein [Litoreibacter roseus]|uniref:Uncharacterized protein n=1 Tax=Litoreibacter roseus TaxID=2601869 RepID=A0A6N6JHL0_9RHOB|nr:hypothetical protein [Litoreibacter roseus]GFE64702.1 hypothetical protein KIN_17760 [Litoreibacter roseus]
MYEGDSFFTLSPLGQAGLLVLSVLLAIFTIIIARKAMRGWSAPLLAIMVFYGFVWLSPQLYYQFYRVIIDGLPQQWVVGQPPSVELIFDILSFQGPSNLSFHGQAILGWCLIILSLVRLRR